jgi:NTP pyrophosphatase (non-canonical NTP hydrolase)
MTVLTEEIGEMARIMARRYGEQSWKSSDPRAKDNGKEALQEEMADVLWVLICLANQTGVDLTEALEKSIEKKTNRDKTRHINNPKLQ